MEDILKLGICVNPINRKLTLSHYGTYTDYS